ncbi:MAG: hypothetical protein HC936_00130 [Leptolyngbyaceae cyanobacterium SU_3_3]|nr:hypothetical protein [Leptolyngbyaceae cyanobacterium SU_3_3]NJR52621.1 hypothetical protein [Leptolyngbyaceae cyanobacterium CSU_1_3]
MNYSPSVLEGLQLPLFLEVQPCPLSKSIVEDKSQALIQEPSAKRVLGGKAISTQGRPPSTKSHACGWVEEKTVKRKRKNSDTWEGKQYWFTWEEPGGKHRCKYIPQAKLKDVQRSIYDLKRSIPETLQVIEKSARGSAGELRRQPEMCF